jgi:hypothetical protein
LKHYVESGLWKQKSQLCIPYKFEIKNTKTNKTEILDTNIIFKTHQIDNKDFLMYKSLCVNWDTSYEIDEIESD